MAGAMIPFALVHVYGLQRPKWQRRLVANRQRGRRSHDVVLPALEPIAMAITSSEFFANGAAVRRENFRRPYGLPEVQSGPEAESVMGVTAFVADLVRGDCLSLS
jgi:hypothetical protein